MLDNQERQAIIDTLQDAIAAADANDPGYAALVAGLQAQINAHVAALGPAAPPEACTVCNPPSNCANCGNPITASGHSPAGVVNLVDGTTSGN